MRTHARSTIGTLACGVLAAAALGLGGSGTGPAGAAGTPRCTVTPAAPTVRSGTLQATARARCPRSDRFSMLVVELERRRGRAWVHVGSDFQITRPDTPLRARVRAACPKKGTSRYRTRAFTYVLSQGRSRTRTRIARATLRC